MYELNEQEVVEEVGEGRKEFRAKEGVGLVLDADECSCDGVFVAGGGSGGGPGFSGGCSAVGSVDVAVDLIGLVLILILSPIVDFFCSSVKSCEDDEMVGEDGGSVCEVWKSD